MLFNAKLIAGIIAFAAVTTSGSFMLGSKRGYDKGYAVAQSECNAEKLQRQLQEYEVERQRLQSILESSTAVVESINKAQRRASQLDKKIEALNEQAVEFTSRPECNLSPSELQAIASAYRVRDSSDSDKLSDPES